MLLNSLRTPTLTHSTIIRAGDRDNTAFRNHTTEFGKPSNGFGNPCLWDHFPALTMYILSNKVYSRPSRTSACQTVYTPRNACDCPQQETCGMCFSKHCLVPSTGLPYRRVTAVSSTESSPAHLAGEQRFVLWPHLAAFTAPGPSQKRANHCVGRAGARHSLLSEPPNRPSPAPNCISQLFWPSFWPVREPKTDHTGTPGTQRCYNFSLA